MRCSMQMREWVQDKYHQLPSLQLSKSKEDQYLRLAMRQNCKASLRFDRQQLQRIKEQQKQQYLLKRKTNLGEGQGNGGVEGSNALEDMNLDRKDNGTGAAFDPFFTNRVIFKFDQFQANMPLELKAQN